MAERTLSISIEVDGAQDAAAQVKRVRSALDDLGGGADGLSRIVREGREVAQVLRDLGTGARNAGDVFKSAWKDVVDYIKSILSDLGSASGASGGGSSVLSGLGALLGGLTIGNSNRAVSGLGGLGSGALAGLGVAGPVGAVVGGIIGGLAGLFGGGNGKEKTHDAAIADQGFAQLKQILDDYNHFRRDFAASMDAANRICAQMQSQWVRPQSAPSQWPFFDAIVRSMQSTEDERNRRRQAVSLQPLPEFSEGGLVGGGSQNRSGVLAVVHPGEFVMSQKAVDRWGVSMLKGLNRGDASGGGGGLTISVDTDSSKWLERNVEALENGIAVILRRGGPVSRALRA